MLRGMITEVDFEEAECSFPGIVGYYRELQVKPETFLELVWGFVQRDPSLCPGGQVAPRVAAPPRVR